MTRHAKDPLHLHHAADRLGHVVAEGAMGLHDATGIIEAWAMAATGVDRAGLQMRLVHVMHDRAVEMKRNRDNAATAIRWAVRPYFTARANAAAIEEAAGVANGGTLQWPEVAAILRDELRRATNTRRA